MLDYKVINTKPIYKGEQYTISAYDTETPKTELFQVVRTFTPVPISETRLRNRILGMINKHQENLNTPEPEPIKTYTEDEVTKILVDKKYITADQTIADLPVKTSDTEVSK